MESTGDMETALEYYQAAEDYLSLARVYCYLNDLEKAAKLANETGDRSAGVPRGGWRVYGVASL